MHNILTWQKERAAPVQAHGFTVTPELVRLRLRLPWGLFEWARPVAVVVTAGGKQERVPIIDVVRVVQVALWLPVAAYGLARLAQLSQRSVKR